MILLSQTDRSFIAHLQPGKSIAYMSRDGQQRTVECDPDHQAARWLHLFNHDFFDDPAGMIVKAWFGDPTRLQNNIPITDRQPVSRALEALLLSCAHDHAALITWECRPRQTRSGLIYSDPVWIPADYTLVPAEQKAVSDAF